MYAYGDSQINDVHDNENVRHEKKKKKHKKRVPEENLDNDMNQNYRPDVRYSEEENYDPDYGNNNPNNYYQNDDAGNPDDYELDEEEERKRRKKERKRKKRQQQLQQEQEEADNHQADDANYPFEGESMRYQQGGYPEDLNHNMPSDEDDDHREDWNHQYDPNDDVAYAPTSEAPVDQTPQPAKKKSGGFGKIFASFKKKKNAAKDSEDSSKKHNSTGQMGDGWTSNPDVFNPAYDGNSSRSSKKVKGKSARDIPSSSARVILLDGEEVEFKIDSKARGQDLFDLVCDTLDLVEKDFFGLTYVSKKLETWFWLEIDKKINKQLSSVDEWIFNFQVKFYPPEPVLLQEDVTRYQLCLQVRQDVYTGKLPCSWITQALLGSFLVQSELGDYDPDLHGFHDSSRNGQQSNSASIEYLREFEFVVDQTDELLQKIVELHMKHTGMSPDKADVKYLETAKRLELYGVDLHPVRDNDNLDILLGVCYQGVLIYRGRDRIGRFAWPKVLRISYKKNYFYLKIRSDRLETIEAIVGFKVYKHELAKRLWKNAVEQHTFFRMKEPTKTATTGRRNQNSSSLFPIRAAMGSQSNLAYGGKTLHQYRSMNISRQMPARFDRSIVKRRTIGSMPAGLNRAGIQYSSMHSLNRAHPRDMTLGKTKSIEYLHGKKPASTLGLGHEMGGSSILHNQPRGSTSSAGPIPAPRHHMGPNRGSAFHNMEESQHSFRSGDSLNASDSYAVRQDDQVSLPPMPSAQPQMVMRPPSQSGENDKKKKSKKKKHRRSEQKEQEDDVDVPVSYSKKMDVLSDDGQFYAPSAPKPQSLNHQSVPVSMVVGKLNNRNQFSNNDRGYNPSNYQQRQRSPSYSTEEEPVEQLDKNDRRYRPTPHGNQQPMRAHLIPPPSPPSQHASMASNGSSAVAHIPPPPPLTMMEAPPSSSTYEPPPPSMANTRSGKAPPPPVKPKPKININIINKQSSNTSHNTRVVTTTTNYQRSVKKWDNDESSNDEML